MNAAGGMPPVQAQPASEPDSQPGGGRDQKKESGTEQCHL